MRKSIEGQTWCEPGTQSLEPHDNGRGNENADGHEVDCDQREKVRVLLSRVENRGSSAAIIH